MSNVIKIERPKLTEAAIHKRARDEGKFVTIMGNCGHDEYIKVDITRMPTLYVEPQSLCKQYLTQGQTMILSIVKKSEVPNHVHIKF